MGKRNVQNLKLAVKQAYNGKKTLQALQLHSWFLGIQMNDKNQGIQPRVHGDLYCTHTTLKAV